jgi:hypothetical protein
VLLMGGGEPLLVLDGAGAVVGAFTLEAVGALTRIDPQDARP